MKMNSKRTLYFAGDITAESIKQLTNELIALVQAAPDDEIYLIINSQGGQSAAGYAFYDTVKLCGAKLTTITMGEASSSATVLFLAGSRRLVGKNASFLIHDMCRSGNNFTFTRNDLERMLTQLKSSTNLYVGILVEKSGGKITADGVFEMMRSDRWLTAQEAITFGLADAFAIDEML